MTTAPDRGPATAAFAAVAARAQNAGYQLLRAPGTPTGWVLADATDGEYLHTASSLAEIARYLDE
ncbi:hypothetical protein [Nocardia carnea]|uniref:hypothetical protein n=1 Tax=Nocardia carnea TaxID=37328 RepID=UPI0024560FB0|nr:hypothetical protein [Nocardia carnea]